MIGEKGLTRDFLESSLAKGTRKVYGGSWNWWVGYTSRWGIADPFLRNYDSRGKGRVLVDIIAVIRINALLSAGSLSSMLSAIRHYFIVEGEDVSFLDLPIVAKARVASSKIVDPPSRRKAITGGSRSLIIPPEVIVSSRPLLWNTNVESMDKIMVYLGVVLAMHFLLRVSEYAKADQGQEEHAFRTGEVFFELEGNLVVMNSCEFVSSISESSSREVVSGVHFRLGSSKTNHHGEGVTLSLSRGGGGFEAGLIDDLTWWCRNASPLPDSLFFRRNVPGRGKSLTRSMVSVEVKRLGTSVGLPIQGVSTHSLRVSGACLLYRNGVSVEEIDRIGRWKPGSVTAMAYRAAVSVTSGAMNFHSEGTDVSETIRNVQIVSATRECRLERRVVS